MILTKTVIIRTKTKIRVYNNDTSHNYNSYTNNDSNGNDNDDDNNTSINSNNNYYYHHHHINNNIKQMKRLCIVHV